MHALTHLVAEMLCISMHMSISTSIGKESSCLAICLLPVTALWQSVLELAFQQGHLHARGVIQQQASALPENLARSLPRSLVSPGRLM